MNAHAPPQQPNMACRNCGAALGEDQNYCGQCGQGAHVGRLTLHEILHEFVHALAHVDRSVFSLLRLLCTRPGMVARDYVAGRRKRYFGPFAFVVIMAGAATAIVGLVGFKVAIGSGGNGVTDAIQHHANLIYLVQVPLLALFCRALFPRQRFNVAECLVLAAYASCIRILIVLLVMIPSWLAFHFGDTGVLRMYYGLSALWFAYFGMACAQFFEGNRIFSFLRGVASAVLVLAAFQLLVVVAVSLANWF
jgi:hypothetical protein